jgi:hypothetical protein
MVNKQRVESHRRKLDEPCPVCKKGNAYLHLIHIEGASWTSLQDTMKACLSCFTKIWTDN